MTDHNTEAEAAAWLARLRASDRSSLDEAAFHAWLAASPSHVAAFEEMNAIWDISGYVPRDLRGYELKSPRRIERRAVLLGLGALVVTAGSFSVWKSATAKVYQTDVGEQKHIVLDDGTRVFLDTETYMEARFRNDLRAVELKYGQASFSVTQDPPRPFVVRAGLQNILSTSAKMDIRQDGDLTSVIVINGQAAVSTEVDRVGSTATLDAGQRLIQKAAGTAKVDRPDMIPLLAWQTGRAIFEGEKLADAVEEMNRYSSVKLIVSSSVLASMRFSGSYTVGDNIAFARAVEKLLPMKIKQDEDRLELILDSARML